MIEYIVYALLAINTVTIVYLIIKVRQPVKVRHERSSKNPDIPEVGEIGDILKEVQPEIERNLKLNEEQKKIVDTWIKTIDATTKSKLMKWILKKLGEWA